MKIADFVVNNGGSLEDLDREIEALLKKLPKGWSIYEDLLALGAVVALGVAAMKAAPLVDI